MTYPALAPQQQITCRQRRLINLTGFLSPILQRKNLFDWKPLPVSCGQSVRLHSQLSRPLCDSQSNTVVSQNNIVATVVHLNVSCNPLAIIGRVRPVVVYSFDSVLRRWAWSHISEKVIKVVPPLAEINSTSTVVIKHGGSWVLASLFDVLPHSVFQPRTIWFSELQSSLTSARYRTAFEQTAAKNISCFAAHAFAMPVRCPRIRCSHRSANNPPTAELLSRKINKSFRASQFVRAIPRASCLLADTQLVRVGGIGFRANRTGLLNLCAHMFLLKGAA